MPPTFDEIALYKQYVSTVENHKRKLSNTIEKVLEHKKDDATQRFVVWQDV
ncbi:hypothetical protein RWE15_19400 [Virgibacillus halophilus]|uniref:Uncharacterized protein n=1 Tax=Tigheibacillus halophilus TaxID=361280 RepID=A0ABU5C9Y1_9BACI|nr:hypothetical protein [Virgibacillus halophilus]